MQLTTTGAGPRISGNFYKAAVQANLLSGAETWVMSFQNGRNLGSLHHRVALRLVKIHPRRYISGI